MHHGVNLHEDHHDRALRVFVPKVQAERDTLTVTAFGLSGERIETEVEITESHGPNAMDVGVNGDLMEPTLKAAGDEQVTLSCPASLARAWCPKLPPPVAALARPRWLPSAAHQVRISSRENTTSDRRGGRPRRA
jgi:hypothetical protein